MHSKPGNRRQFLTTSALGAAAGVAGLAALHACAPRESTPAPEAAAAQPAPAGLPRERYEQYVDWFNQNDPRFLEFYHPDVVLELGAATLEGANAIRDFYAQVKEHIKETVTINHYVSDATGVAAEIPTEFKVFKDWPQPNYFRRDLKAGEVMRVISFGMYWMEDGKFRRIKAARYKLVNEWKLEA
jgi:hypothetical protein